MAPASSADFATLSLRAHSCFHEGLGEGHPIALTRINCAGSGTPECIRPQESEKTKAGGWGLQFGFLGYVNWATALSSFQPPASHCEDASKDLR